jgi:hypothetical protein
MNWLTLYLELCWISVWPVVALLKGFVTRAGGKSAAGYIVNLL